MGETIKLGIIGLGAMGVEMLSVAAAHPDYQLGLCADIDPQTLKRLATQYPQLGFTTSAAEVLNAADIDAVYIATPPHWHADYAIQAMQQGKAVFCEKPLAISLADGERMVAVAKQTQVANAVNFALADRHAVLAIERGLAAGEAGDILGVEIRLIFPQWPRRFQADASWLAGREQGGFVREVFSHFAYLTDRLLGPLSMDIARLGFTGSVAGSETQAYGRGQAGGVPVSFSGQAGVAAPETYEWYLYGSRRSYCLRNWGELWVAAGEDWQRLHLTGERGSERSRLSAFAQSIRQPGQHSLPDFAAGLRVQRCVEAFHGQAND